MSEDHLIERLESLCLRFAETPLQGRYEVAKRAVLSEQYLYQLLAGKPMTNDSKRSVGKIARAKLSKAFPDWLETKKNETEKSTYSVSEPKKTNIQDMTARVSRERRELFEIIDHLNDMGCAMLLVSARQLKKDYPKIKANPAS